MIRRVLIILITIPVVLLGLAVLTKGWLVDSDAGSRWLLNRAISSLDGRLSIGKAEGSLGDGMVLTSIQYEQDGLLLEIPRVETEATVSLVRLEVKINSLSVNGLSITQLDTVTGSNSTTESLLDILPSLRLSIPVNIQNMVITGLRFPVENNEPPLYLDKLSLSGRWADAIELQQLDVQTTMLTMGLRGKIDLEPPFAHAWSASGTLAETGLHLPRIDFDLTLEGDAGSTRIMLSSQAPGIEIEGVVTDMFDAALLDLKINASQFTWIAKEAGTEWQISDLSGKVEGPINNYYLALQTVVQTEGFSPMNFTLAAQGDLERLQISSLEIHADTLDVGVTGMVEWVDTASVDLLVNLRRIEPTIWFVDWPRQHYIHGRLTMTSTDTGIQLRELGVGIAETEIDIRGEGIFDLQEEILNASLSWQGIGWPFGLDSYEYASESGQLRITGSPADWQFNGDLALETRDYPGGKFELAGGGNLGAATISIVNGEALGGTLAGQASLDWSEAFRWNAELDMKQVDPGALLSDWPARLDTKLVLFQDTGKDLLELQFDDLHGVLRDQAVAGSGGLVIEESAIRFRNVRLQSGKSDLFLNGDLDDPDGLDFVFEVHKPGWMADFLGGEVSARGHIALEAPQAVLDIELRAHELEWGETRVGNVLITSGEPVNGDEFNLRFEAENLEFGNSIVPAVKGFLVGDRTLQTLDLNVTGSDNELEAKISGAVDNWHSLEDNHWSGSLDHLHVSSAQGSLVTLQDAASIVVSAAEISLGRACFEFEVSGGICAESRWRPDGHLDIAASLSALSLGASQLIFDHDVEFTQVLDGEIRWSNKPGQFPSGRVAINISSGQFGEDHDDSDRVVTAEGFLGFELANGNLTSGELDIPFPGIGKIDLDYAISGLALDGTGKIDGDVNINMTDISALDELLPGLEKTSGQLDINLSVSGVTSDPQLDGNIKLSNSSTDIPDLGAQLRQLSLDGMVSSNDTATIRGAFTAGEGNGDIAVTLDFSDWLSPAMEMTFSGSDLRMLNTPQLRMDADSDFRLDWKQGEWVIDGGVVVQRARIAPLTFVVNKITESEDIQLVAGSLPFGGREKATKPVRFSGNLEVSLGDNVEIDTDLAKAKLAGAVMLTWSEELLPTAEGNIRVNGTLSVFGPVLHIKGGQVRFPGIPVDNPMLNLRAERAIFGNTQIRTAGVSITGTARRPVIEAFTNPHTTSDRAWAVLITGSDVDFGQGIGAIEVGTYIAPRLYLGYGISLFDNDNVVSARYDLTNRFGVKVSSGQRESGVDISYTIER